MFVGCLPGDAQEPELLTLLKSFAKVTSIKLARGRNQSAADYCRGYGFAFCPSYEDLQILLSANNSLYRGRAIVVKPYKAGSVLKSEKKDFRQRRLFIGNVPLAVTEENLRPHFEKYGRLEALCMSAPAKQN